VGSCQDTILRAAIMVVIAVLTHPFDAVVRAHDPVSPITLDGVSLRRFREDNREFSQADELHAGELNACPKTAHAQCLLA
jgi:hypothetical protein